MCGIAGIVRFNHTELDLKKHILSMGLAIHHRGPDDEGFLFHNNEKTVAAYGNNTVPAAINNGLAYGATNHIESLTSSFDLVLHHKRLSILDLSAGGHQPMCAAHAQLWITFNGEIYNYLELKIELEKLGHHFISTTDTEVVLIAYKTWGKACLKKFNGMWSFVIFDKEKNIFFGARDRFGVKPFYYFHDKNVFAFASEQKALVKLPFINSTINDAAVFDYFVKGEIEYEQESFFTNIIELFPAQCFELQLSTGHLGIETYYQLSYLEDYAAFDQQAFEAARDKTKELFIDSVKLRMRSDVPVGSCLSGGIDSSAIVGVMDLLNKQAGVKEKIKVFTATFNDIDIDESAYAAKVVDVTNSDFYKVSPTSANLLTDLENLIYCQDVPIWSTSTYAQYSVMKKAKEQGIKVVLDGQGGDELFAGYHTYFYNYWIELLSKGKLLTLNKEMKGFLPFPHRQLFFLKQHLRFNTVKKLPTVFQQQINRNYFGDLYFLNSDFLNDHRDRLKEKSRKKYLNNELAHEFTNTRLKSYLKCEDRCSMWHSVESRTPFADDINLIEYVFSQRPSFKIKNGVNKYLLRESMRNIVPNEILRRNDKLGFATPNARWINEIKNDVRDYFDDSLAPYYDMERINRFYDKLFANNANANDTRIFKFIAFAVWKKVFKL